MIILRSFIIALVLLLMAGRRAEAQNPVSINYTADDGLPSDEVYDIFEDSLGYIWLATDHGISRFDGYSFKNYSTNEGLTHNTVFGFFEDRRHRIWMRTINGTLCYMEKGAIYSYEQNDSLRKFLGRHFIENFGIDSIGDLWFMPGRFPLGLFHQDHKTGRIRKVKLQPGFDAFIREIDTDKFIAGAILDSMVNKKKDSIIYSDHTWQFNTMNPSRLGRNLVRAIRKSKDHYVFSHNYNLIEFDKHKILHRYTSKYPDIIINDLCEDGSCFWIMSKGIHKAPGDPFLSFFEDATISEMLIDKRGGYWLSTYDKGIIHIPNIHILEIKNDRYGDMKLLTPYKKSFFAVSSAHQILEWPLKKTGPDTPAVSSGLIPAFLYDISSHLQTDELIFGKQVYTIAELRQLNAFEKKNAQGHGHPMPGYTRYGFRMGDRFFFAGSDGWSIINKNGKALYKSIEHGFSKSCFTLCMDSTGTLWIGTSDGLYTFRNNHIYPFRAKGSLFRQRITDIQCLPSGIVAVSTRGVGVLLIDKGQEYVLRASDGLTTDLCEKLVVEDTVVWVCTNNGLNRISLKRDGNGKLLFKVTQMLTEHGLSSNLINDAFRYGNFLILATGKGLCWFDVRKVFPNTYTPIVYISEVKANQHLLDPNEKLDHNDNNLQFSFIGLLFNNPGKVRYRYKLEEYENEWHYTRELSVHYFNLPAGHYRFVVAAMNEDGKWSERPATYTFSIPLHFSETWWFLMLILLFIVAIVWLALRYYLRQRRARERITSDLLLAELKTLRSQMKPHFIFNSLSSIQHFILESDQESAHLYLSRFSDLMRKILENTQKNTISLSREIETLDIYLSLETLRFGKNFEYTISVSSDILKDMTEVPPMLIQPYVENAIWHGLLMKKNNARLWLRFFSEGDTLVCEIEDNGIGRKAAQMRRQTTHQSTGMKNIQERIDILNRVGGWFIQIEILDLYDADKNAAGTKVTLKLSDTLPIKNKRYDTHDTHR